MPLVPLVLLPHGIHGGGIYIRELGRAYAAIGCRVVFNADNFREALIAPDLVHLHWPEEHYRWGETAPLRNGRRGLLKISTG